MAVLKQRIALLLRDKENTAMTATVANSWLSNEAASFQAVNRAGTFRSLLQYCPQFISFSKLLGQQNRVLTNRYCHSSVLRGSVWAPVWVPGLRIDPLRL